MLRLNVAYQLHAAACASLPFPTMSNNRALFFAWPTTRKWSAAPSAEAGFYALLRTRSITFLHSFVSFFFAAFDPGEGLSKRRTGGIFPGRKRTAEPRRPCPYPGIFEAPPCFSVGPIVSGSGLYVRSMNQVNRLFGKILAFPPQPSNALSQGLAAPLI